MEDGTVTPADLEQMERETATRAAETEAGMQRLVEVLRAHRHEPIFVRCAWAELVQLVDAARAAGIEDGGWAPGSIVCSGGGQKSKFIPDDFRDRTGSFLDGCRFVDTFGMSEINNSFVHCDEGRKHAPAQLVPLILDVTGEQVIGAQSGKLVGRLALFDLTLDGRWGGVITSDEVEADFSPCACGRRSMGLDSVQRYGRGTVGGDDKLTCAGTISAYVRGAIGA
jgi:hypothetical protein